MQLTAPTTGHPPLAGDHSIGRIVSVTGSKAIVLLDAQQAGRVRSLNDRPEMGTLLAIDTANTIVFAIVSALSVPVPAQREGDAEIWIAELGLVGELWKGAEDKKTSFNRGVTVYPALGDRVRVASKLELEIAFCGDMERSVRVGCIRQDPSIPAMVRVDDLLGKHFAILGTTGTGKSCTTALVLRSILEKNPAAHIVLLDPHNEYATAFGDWAEVISPRNMQLPFWLLNFEEIVEVLIGDPERKAEIEILQELIPVAKSRYSTGRTGDSNNKVIRRGVLDTGRYTVDTPVPYRISDLTSLIDERMGKLENKRDLAPYRQLKNCIDNISQDGRYGFMFGSLTVYDGMTQVLGRIFRVPVNDKPITILELTGLPTEIVNVVVSVLCRMTFDFALWSEGQIPVTLVCEEAHRYVPVNSALGFEPCKRAIAKIAKEGRKYGASLCIVTQRPAEIDPTILSQCNTVFALRMANDKDQAIVQSAVADTGSGLLEFLPSLGQREAIAFGDGMSLPVRIKFDELPKHFLPRSSTARFSEKWQKSMGDEGFLEQVVDRWRASGIGSGGDMSSQVAMMADAVGLTGAHHDHESDVDHVTQPFSQPHAYGEPGQSRSSPQSAPSGFGQQSTYGRSAQSMRKESGMGQIAQSANGYGGRPAPGSAPRGAAPPPPAEAQSAASGNNNSLRSLRDRLMRHQN
ncbi:MAG: DUF87 domain-containing protein [Hyphomicrobium sp.]